MTGVVDHRPHSLTRGLSLESLLVLHGHINLLLQIGAGSVRVVLVGILENGLLLGELLVLPELGRLVVQKVHGVGEHARGSSH